MRDVENKKREDIAIQRSNDPRDLSEKLEKDVLFPSEREGRVIDFHVHLWEEDKGKSAKDILNMMDASNIERICLLSPLKYGKDEVLVEKVQEGEGRILGFAVVENIENINDIENLIKKQLVHGLKVFPGMFNCYAGDEKLFPIYEVATEYHLPILFHSGVTGSWELESKFFRPVFYEKAARKFPDLDMVLAHMSWPWVDEAIGIAYITPNIYLDISTGAPRIYKEEA